MAISEESPVQDRFIDLFQMAIVLLAPIGSISIMVIFPVVFWISVSIIGSLALYCLIQYDIIPAWKKMIATCECRARITEIERTQPRNSQKVEAVRKKRPINHWWALRALLVLAGVLLFDALFFWGVYEIFKAGGKLFSFLFF
jgi:hypothetical protein